MAETHDINALKGRDAAALDRLVREESGLVYRCIGRMIRDEDEVRNLTQETFLQAIQNIESFRGESKISTWLCSIAINLARAHLRRSRRYDVMAEEDLEGLLPTFGLLGHGREEYHEWNPEKYTEQEERVSLIREALDRLPEDYKTVIVLRDLEELSTIEVAQLLDTSEGAVRVRLHRARMALRKLLDGRMTD
ncbi:MAG TPA: sigma-70 family RNA polymerase sigma factor [Rhodothermia bacterium]|nr:sigma-70 family RNA polymerase sigma factor [Rhodothermia bacterium]